MPLPRIKICCIQNEQEGADAISLGASAIGLVGAMPSGPDPISDPEILRIAMSVPPPSHFFAADSMPKMCAKLSRWFNRLVWIFVRALGRTGGWICENLTYSFLRLTGCRVIAANAVKFTARKFLSASRYPVLKTFFHFPIAVRFFQVVGRTETTKRTSCVFHLKQCLTVCRVKSNSRESEDRST